MLNINYEQYSSATINPSLQWNSLSNEALGKEKASDNTKMQLTLRRAPSIWHLSSKLNWPSDDSVFWGLKHYLDFIFVFGGAWKAMHIST